MKDRRPLSNWDPGRPRLSADVLAATRVPANDGLGNGIFGWASPDRLAGYRGSLEATAIPLPVQPGCTRRPGSAAGWPSRNSACGAGCGRACER